MSCKRRATPPAPAARSSPAAAEPHLHRRRPDFKSQQNASTRGERRLGSAPAELQPQLIKLKAAGAASSNKKDFIINYAEMCAQQILDDKDFLSAGAIRMENQFLSIQIRISNV